MTIQNALLSAARLPVLGLLFLLITGQMAAFIAAHRDGRSRRAKGAFLSCFLLSVGVLWLCLSVIAWGIDYPDWIPEPPPVLAALAWKVLPIVS